MNYPIKNPPLDEPRARIIAQATRNAIVTDIRLARAGLVVGFGTMLVGGGILAAVVMWPVGMLPQVMLGMLAAAVMPVGLARVIRSLGAIYGGRRRLRTNDAAALPAARVVVRSSRD